MTIRDIVRKIPEDRRSEVIDELNCCAGEKELLETAGKYGLELSEDELESISGGEDVCLAVGFVYSSAGCPNLGTDTNPNSQT